MFGMKPPAVAKLRAWLLKPGNSQTRLADELGVSQAAVQKWSVGKTRPSAHHRQAIEKITEGAVPEVGWETRQERALVRKAKPYLPTAPKSAAA